MSRDLIRQLNQLKHGEVNPRAEWLTNNREILLSQIKNTIAAAGPQSESRHFQDVWSSLSIFLPQKFVYNVMRPMTVILIILSIATSGWVATVDAAYEALPGDILYPAKRVAEKTRVAVASVLGDKKKETKLHVEFAQRRVRETKQIMAGTDPKKNDMAARSVADLKTEIKNVNNSLEEIKAVSTNQLSADVVKDVKKDTEQIQSVLQGMKDDLSTSTTTVDKDLSKQVSETNDLVKDTAVKAIEVMVAKHLDGDNSVSKEDIKSEIDTTLQTAVAGVAESKQNVEGVKKAVEAVKTEVKDLTKESAQQNSVITTSTKELSEKIIKVASQAKEAAVKTEAASVEVDKKVTEAKSLLFKDDLSKAVDKIKEVTAATKEVEKITDNTLKNVQTMLPIMNVVKEGIANNASSTFVIITTTTPAVAPEKAPIMIIVSTTPQTVAPVKK